MSDWASRRLHFIGVGGAGMSGLALVCAELGASVTGSDRSESSYMERLRAAGLDPIVGHDAANLPEDAEVVVSTAIGTDNPELALARERGIEPIHRGALLAELCAEKRLIAVAGTHGKTTTTAMLVWALRGWAPTRPSSSAARCRDSDPAARPPTPAGDGGEWVIAEADESDGSFLDLKPEIAVVTNIEMDHHSRWGSVAELRAAFAEFTAGARAVVRPEDSDLEIELAVPGHHNLLNARAAVLAAEAAGFEPAKVAAALADFLGVKRRLELKGSRAGVRIYDDYAHHPTEVRAALSALREQGPGRLIAVFQPHLYSRTKAFGEEFGAALALADEVVVLDVYPAREQPVGELAGVSGLQVAQAAAERMGGRRVLWLPDPSADALARLLDRNQAVGVTDQVLVTIGAGDVFKLGEALVEWGGTMSPQPAAVQSDFPLARLTTVRTGGDADFFARPGNEGELLAVLAWAADEGLPLGVIGSGSNLLVADSGFRGLALKLDRELATIEREGEGMVCGGGARFPSTAAKAAGWGLAGIEFGVNIPGTAGGAVKMNANAYGGQLAEVLAWVDVFTARGRERRGPDELGFAYRSSNLSRGRGRLARRLQSPSRRSGGDPRPP